MTPQPTADPSGTHTAIETVFRIESPRIIAGVTRVVRDVGIAEELAQDAPPLPNVRGYPQSPPWSSGPGTGCPTTRAPGS